MLEHTQALVAALIKARDFQAAIFVVEAVEDHLGDSAQELFSEIMLAKGNEKILAFGGRCV